VESLIHTARDGTFISEYAQEKEEDHIVNTDTAEHLPPSEPEMKGL